jgi:hypothetical protein
LIEAIELLSRYSGSNPDAAIALARLFESRKQIPEAIEILLPHSGENHNAACLIGFTIGAFTNISQFSILDF